MDVEQLTRPTSVDEAQLADVLLDCVQDGASVGFLSSLTHHDSVVWWRDQLTDPDAMTWVARDDARRIVGTVRLVLATKPNARHRADVCKLLVHRAARGLGVAGRLMTVAEDAARSLGRTLLVLDTHSGSPAESLYLRRGWARVGTIDAYAATPDGVLVATTILTKRV